MANYIVRKFQGDIEKWIKQVKSGLDDVVREFVKAVHADLVKGSPVDTGRFRANWQITYNHIPMYALNEYDKTGDKTIAAGIRTANALPLEIGRASCRERARVTEMVGAREKRERNMSKLSKRLRENV